MRRTGRKMLSVQNFLRDESGAVTIDFVSLVAGIALLGMAAVYSIFTNGVQSTFDIVNTELATYDIQIEIGSAPLLND